LRIAVIAAHYPPRASAAAVRVACLVREWASREVQLHVYTESRRTHEASMPEPEAAARVRVHRIPLATPSNRSPILLRLVGEVLGAVLVGLRLLAGPGVDGYLVSSPPLIWALVAALAARVRGRPLFLDVRDPYPEVLFAAGVISRAGPAACLLLWLERRVYARARFITTVTAGFRDHISAKTTTPVHLVRNGYDPALLAWRGRGHKQDAFVLLSHGTLGRFQGTEMLLDYARFLIRSRAAGVKVCLVGGGPAAAELAAAVNREGLEPVLELRGPTSFPEVGRWIASASVGLSLRTDDSLGRTAFPVRVYECLALGVPVIVYPPGEAGALLEQHAAGFQLETGSPEALHLVVERLREDEALYRQYAENAERLAREFDRARLARRLLELIQEQLTEAA
jgi:glycosyltransferase involved in cell wall biosynthesis